jgi:hypothetical protein
MSQHGAEPPPGATEGRLGDLVRALAVHWTAVKAALEPPDRERLEALVDQLDRLDPDHALTALEDVIAGADLPPDHAVMQLFYGRIRYAQTLPVEDPQRVRAALSWLAAAVRQDPATVASIAAEPVTAASVRRRLAAVPAYGPEDVADPAAPELIRLRVDGRVRLPRFQFGADRSADRVVLEVNRLLDAEHDPWGVASWWLDRHAWLRGKPVDLLDGTPEQRLRVAAAAAAEVAD